MGGGESHSPTLGNNEPGFATQRAKATVPSSIRVQATRERVSRLVATILPFNRIRPGLNAGATAHKILRLCLAVVSGRYC
jgi:hypothetical protein